VTHEKILIKLKWVRGLPRTFLKLYLNDRAEARIHLFFVLAIFAAVLQVPMVHPILYEKAAISQRVFNLER
jgi:hypothetical protein